MEGKKLTKVKRWIKEHKAELEAGGSVALIIVGSGIIGYVFGSVDNECKIAEGMQKAINNGNLDLRNGKNNTTVDPWIWCESIKAYNRRN